MSAIETTTTVHDGFSIILKKSATVNLPYKGVFVVIPAYALAYYYSNAFQNQPVNMKTKCSFQRSQAPNPNVSSKSGI
jgi:hypothetical protein